MEFQIQKFDVENHLIVYVCRKLCPAERRYAAVKRETLAIKWVVEGVLYCVSGPQFTLVTVHMPLQWMAKAKDFNSCMTRRPAWQWGWPVPLLLLLGLSPANSGLWADRGLCGWSTGGSSSPAASTPRHSLERTAPTALQENTAVFQHHHCFVLLRSMRPGGGAAKWHSCSPLVTFSPQDVENLKDQ